MVMMRGHNICFNAEIWKISLSYPCYPFLSGAMNSTGLIIQFYVAGTTRPVCIQDSSPGSTLNCHTGELKTTVKILKFGTPNTIAIIVLKLVKFDVTLH